MTKVDPRTLKPIEGTASTLHEVYNRIAENQGVDLDAPPQWGPEWKAHADYEKEHPDALVYATDLENKRKASFLGLGGDEAQYVPARQFPCPGTLRLDGDVEARDPMLMVECDVCGFELTIPRERFDPHLASRLAVRRARLPRHFVGKPFHQQVEGQELARQVMRDWIAEWDNVNHEEGDYEPVLPAPALVGRPGRGKSHLMVITAEYVIKKYKLVAGYWPLAELMQVVRDLHSNVSDAREVAEAQWKRAMNCVLLVLDDIGAERPTDFAAERFGILVDHRYNNVLPILVSSNVEADAWGDMFGERTASRLRGMAHPFAVDAPDDLRIEPPPDNVDPETGEVRS